MLIEPDPATSGGSISVTYVPAPAWDDVQLAPDPTVQLYNADRGLYDLVVRDVFGPGMEDDGIKDFGGGPQLSAALNGGGPWKYDLPELDPGTYRLCAGVGGVGLPADQRLVCADFEIRG